jgi:hypothetical protein
LIQKNNDVSLNFGKKMQKVQPISCAILENRVEYQKGKGRKKWQFQRKKRLRLAWGCAVQGII